MLCPCAPTLVPVPQPIETNLQDTGAHAGHPQTGRRAGDWRDRMHNLRRGGAPRHSRAVPAYFLCRQLIYVRGIFQFKLVAIILNNGQYAPRSSDKKKQGRTLAWFSFGVGVFSLPPYKEERALLSPWEGKKL